MSVWMPIESAPRDGTDVLLGFHGPRSRPLVVAAWFVEGWYIYDDPNRRVKPEPSHWMRIPAPPTGDL